MPTWGAADLVVKAVVIATEVGGDREMPCAEVAPTGCWEIHSP